MLHHSGCNAMRFVVVGDVMVAISIGLGVSVLSCFDCCRCDWLWQLQNVAIG